MSRLLQALDGWLAAYVRKADFPLTNLFFSPSTLKQRILMLQKPASSRWALSVYALSLLAMLVSFLFVSSCQNELSETDTTPGKTLITVSGTTVDAQGQPLPGARITVQGLNRTVVSGADGRYKLENIPSNAKITYSTLGFHEVTVSVDGQTTIPVIFRRPLSTKPEEEVFMVVEKEPEFPGGYEALRQFLAQHLRYPEPALRAEVEGKVFVSFVIRKNGKVTDVKILKGMGFGTDEETMRVMNTLPNWKPGYQNGKPVDVRYTIPVDFTLPKKTAQADKQASAAEENDEMDPTFYEDIRRNYKTFLVNGKSVSFDEYVRLDKYSYAGNFDLKTKTVSISVKLPNK